MTSQQSPSACLCVCHTEGVKGACTHCCDPQYPFLNQKYEIGIDPGAPEGDRTYFPPLTNEEKAELRRRIVEMVPAIKRPFCKCRSPKRNDGNANCWFCGVYLCRTIHLADILLTLHKSLDQSVAVTASGEFFVEGEPTGVKWDVTKDSLDDQATETKRFLYRILPA